MLLAAIAFLLGLGLGATQPSVMSLMYTTAPRAGGEAMGVRSIVLQRDHTFLPLLFGGGGTALGIAPVFWAMAGLLAGGAWMADRRRRATANDAPHNA